MSATPDPAQSGSKLWLIFFAPPTPDLKGVIVRADSRPQALAHARRQAQLGTLNEPDYMVKELPVDGAPGVVEGILQ